MPGIAFGDWGEMATVPHVLGVAHPTGYPTYIVMAWLAELLPIGSVAFRANLLSAVYVTITLATISLISLRLGVRPVIAIAGALATGAVGTVWAAATVSEVNPLHLMFVALIVHRALVWADGRRRSDLAIGGLLIGLALGNHLLMLFVAPVRRPVRPVGGPAGASGPSVAPAPGSRRRSSSGCRSTSTSRSPPCAIRRCRTTTRRRSTASSGS